MKTAKVLCKVNNAIAFVMISRPVIKTKKIIANQHVKLNKRNKLDE